MRQPSRVSTTRLEPRPPSLPGVIGPGNGGNEPSFPSNCLRVSRCSMNCLKVLKNRSGARTIRNGLWSIISNCRSSTFRESYRQPRITRAQGQLRRRSTPLDLECFDALPCTGRYRFRSGARSPFSNRWRVSMVQVREDLRTERGPGASLGGSAVSKAGSRSETPPGSAWGR